MIQAVDDMGKLDDTLIIYISGDNGSSAEGSPNGTPSEVLQFNGVELPVDKQMKFYDVWGTDQTYPHMAVAWTWAFDTPFKWTKQIPSFFGGTRQGMAISWPGHITDTGGIRNQFSHVIDIVPTLLEVTGIPAPVMVDGVGQKPMDGVSLAYTFDKANADAPSRHHTQYFEMMGVRGLYHDGWMLSTVPKRAPWVLVGTTTTDPANAYGVGALRRQQGLDAERRRGGEDPDKLKEMQQRLWTELAKYQALPLDASVATRLVAPRPNVTAGRSEFNYSGETVTGIPHGDAPNLLDTSYTITAEVEIPRRGRRGHDPHQWRPVRRLWLLSPEEQACLPCGTCLTSNGRAGRPRSRSAPASTPSRSTSNMMDWVWARSRSTI